jgi:hypothetical protein
LKFFHRDDPLLKSFFETYGLNLLTIPREKASIGDVYIRVGNDRRLSMPTSITNLLIPTFKIPMVPSEKMADVSSKVSMKRSLYYIVCASAIKCLKYLIDLLHVITHLDLQKLIH